MSENIKLPDEFKYLFWDVVVEEIDIKLHKKFIIERLLNEGDHLTLKWLFNVYEEEDIFQVVIGSRNLSIKTARYWQYYFNLKEVEMRCFLLFRQRAGYLVILPPAIIRTTDYFQCSS